LGTRTRTRASEGKNELAGKGQERRVGAGRGGAGRRRRRRRGRKGEKRVLAASREAHTGLAGYSHFRSYTHGPPPAGAFSFASRERARLASVCVRE